MPRVLVIGSTNVDLTFRVARLPRPGETVPGHSLAVGFGGKGANQAAMAARLGADVAFLSAVGDDDFGRHAVANLRRQGVDTTHVRTAPGLPTGTAAIVVDDAAANAIVVVAGANAALSADDIRAARDAIESADVVVAQMETPVEATREAFRLARAAGRRTVLNPAPAVPGAAELLPLADLCVPNETELEALTGAQALADLERAAAALLARGARAALVTLGASGSFFQDDRRSLRVPAFAVEAVDPTAAGDAYIGSLAVSLAAGLVIDAAMLQASAAAALAVTRPGAQASFPTAGEVEAFLAAHRTGAGTPGG
jgi:ribokinase